MYINEFLNHIANVRRYSQRTVGSYRNNLVAFAAYLNERSITEVSPKVLGEYVEFLMNNGLKPTSINQYLASIRSYYDYCCRFEGVERNPALGVHDVRTPKLLPQFISEDKMNYLLDTMPSQSFKQMRARLVIMIFYHTGMRCVELERLRFCDVNLDKDFLHVFGKGNKERYIPFGRELHNEFLKYYALVPNRNCPVIIQTSYGEGCSSHQIRIICKTALLRIVRPELAHPHILRHSFATALMNHGARIENVRLLLGHASINTTAIYQHVSMYHLRNTYNLSFK